MIRFAIVLAVLGAACAESPADTLADLEGRAMQCGEIELECVLQPDPNVVLTCMNNALASGQLAEATWQDDDDHMYAVVTYVFADGGTVRSFVSEPDDFGGPETTIVENPSCAGPLMLVKDPACPGNQILSAAGCP